MPIDRRALLISLAALSACARQTQPSSGPLTVYAAASLKNALDEVNASYAASPGGVPVAASYAASSTLARQIEQGAAADVFISADSAWMDHAASFIRAGTRRDLLRARLALVAPIGSSVELTLAPGVDLAGALGKGRLAMAADDVPAGRYGRAALEALGAWTQVRDRVAYGENVRAALRFVAEGEAPLGIVYDTDALVEPKVRLVGLFPDASHPPIVYPGAVLSSAENPAAQAYLDYLTGQAAKAIFARFGFKTPAD